MDPRIKHDIAESSNEELAARLEVTLNLLRNSAVRQASVDVMVQSGHADFTMEKAEQLSREILQLLVAEYEKRVRNNLRNAREVIEHMETSERDWALKLLLEINLKEMRRIQEDVRAFGVPMDVTTIVEETIATLKGAVH